MWPVASINLRCPRTCWDCRQHLHLCTACRSAAQLDLFQTNSAVKSIEVDGGFEGLCRFVGCLKGGHVQPASGGCQREHAVASANVNNQWLGRALVRSCGRVGGQTMFRFKPQPRYEKRRGIVSPRPKSQLASHQFGSACSQCRSARACLQAGRTLRATWQVGQKVLYDGGRPAQQVVGLPKSISGNLMGDIHTLLSAGWSKGGEKESRGV